MITVSYKNTTKEYLKNNQHAWVEYVTCDKTDVCPLYAQGKCACFRYIIGSNLTCPNGEWHYKTGPTKRANKFYDFAKMVRDEYAPTASEFKAKLCEVADYIYLPLNFLMSAQNKFTDAEIINEHFIRTNDFNANIVEKLLCFVPLTWFDSAPIRKYTQGQLPTAYRGGGLKHSPE